MLNSGQILRQYRIERFIGKGGMGEVYLATDTKLRRKVALKLLPSGSPVDERRKKRFVREAIAASRFNHPNVAVVYDADETEDGVAFISMEYVEGETLSSRLSHGPLPIDEVRSYALQIAEGLDEAHRHGIVHRDVKPANIMIDGHGRAKILDFGLARVFEETDVVDSTDLTKSAESLTIAGTPAYMSPEQARGDPLDQRTDIFSFGVVLYEMITGRNPFAAPSSAAVLSSILTTRPSPIRPAELNRIVAKAIEKDRDLRYQTARDIAVDLQRATDVTVPKRSRVLPAAAVAILIVALIALLLWKSPRAAPRPQSIDSIAVLPFENLSSNADGDFLADGMTEALITNLAQIRALKVISRTSVMQYKKTRKSLRQIGSELGVGAVLEGSVVHAGGRVRVTAQLIDARADQHLWADKYDRDMRDVLRLEDEIARAVVDQVRVQLLPAERIRLTRARAIDPRAQQLYVRARYDWNSRNRQLVPESAHLLEQAIAIEPAWALAYAALADSYNIMANNKIMAADEAFPKAKAAAQKALELDPDLGQAHAALAHNLWQYEREYAAAEVEFRRAIGLLPSYATAHHFYALYLATFGRDAEALSEIRKALDLDPLAPRINTNYGDVLYQTGHDSEAIVQLEKWVAMDPRQARAGLVQIYVHLNRSVDAMKVANEAAAANDPNAKALRALALASARHEKALPFIREVDRDRPPSALGDRAVVSAYVVAGDVEDGWAAFERAAEVPTAFILREPICEPLMRDRRYPALLRNLGLQ